MRDNERTQLPPNNPQPPSDPHPDPPPPPPPPPMRQINEDFEIIRRVPPVDRER